MSTSDIHPGVSFMEASAGVPPTQGSITAVDALPTSSAGSQTTVVTSSSNNPNSVSVSPPFDAASNATSASVSNSIISQPSLSSNGNQMNQEQLDLDAIEKGARGTGTYTGALIMTAVAVPVVAALISAIAFVVQWPMGVGLPGWLSSIIGTPLLLGTVSTLIVWLLLGFFVRRFTAADRINMESYGQLLNRLSALYAQINVLYPEPATIPPTVAIASKEVLDCRDAIRKKLVRKGLAWVTATGYINLWKEMHNAEEALIEMLPREAVIADALYDELRIQDSKIDNSDELLQRLRLGVTVLDPSVKAYLQSPPSDPLPADAISDRQARSVLREVRHALNEFRDDRWEAIVRIRNQFVCTTILTGLTLYVLLQFAILAGAMRQAIISATAFYLVGGLVGLFSRLYNESQTSKSVDDYRLSLARLVATPLYTGLAAVGGVLVTQQVTSLAALFDPTKLLPGLIVAAGFGLTPSLLMNTLQKQTETYKNDLKSTSATQGPGVKTSATQSPGVKTS